MNVRLRWKAAAGECLLHTESGRSDMTPAATEAGCLGAKRRPGFPKDCAC
jgi:hypothetical protein